MRRAAKRDESEPGIVKAIEAAGWRWFRVSDAGLFDGFAVKTGVIVPGEIKTGDGKLTPRQVVLFAALEAVGVKVHVWRTPLEALAALGCTAVEARRGMLAAAEHEACAAGTPSSLGEVEAMLSAARQRLGIGVPAALVPAQSSTKALGPVRSKRGPTAAYVPPRTDFGPCSVSFCEGLRFCNGSTKCASHYAEALERGAHQT